MLTTPFSLHALGGCLPAAHPLTGFVWLCVGFVLYPSARTQALRAWSLAFALGAVFGLVQIARGAHFVSHVLWCAWVVWCVNIAILGVCVPTTALTGERQRRTQH
jgi:membrane-associated PAP2 superfamily phosphatase